MQIKQKVLHNKPCNCEPNGVEDLMRRGQHQILKSFKQQCCQPDCNSEQMDTEEDGNEYFNEISNLH